MRFFNFPEYEKKILGYQAYGDHNSFEYQNTEHNFELDENESAIVESLKDIVRKCWNTFGRII